VALAKQSSERKVYFTLTLRLAIRSRRILSPKGEISTCSRFTSQQLAAKCIQLALEKF